MGDNMFSVSFGTIIKSQNYAENDVDQLFI